MSVNKLYIDLKAVRHNLKAIQARVPHKKVMAIVKADAYGTGAIAVSQALEPDVWGFGVATAEEALTLRTAGILKPILVLGYVLPEMFPHLLQNDIQLTVFDREGAFILNQYAEKIGRMTKIHLKLNTGHNRLGFRPQDIETIHEVYNLSHLDCVGIFSHYAAADDFSSEAIAYTQMQKEDFEKTVNILKESGYTFQWVHLANDPGLLAYSDSGNMVRSGICLYGAYPSEEVKQREEGLLKTVVRLESRISFLHTLYAGESVSYNCTFKAPHNMQIATVSCGYADGVPRILSNRGVVVIHGKQAPILGRVCMDQLMVDVGHIPEAKKGDPVVFFGLGGIDIDQFAAWAQTNSYEILTGIRPRVERIYYEGSWF